MGTQSSLKQACSNFVSAALGSRPAYPLTLALTKIGMRGLGINGGYELHESGEQWFLERALPAIRNCVVADVGANIGEFAILARRLGAAQVLAFEPSEKTFLALVANTSMDPSVTCFRTAVGESDEPTDFYIPMDEAASALASRDVAVTSMDKARTRKITVPMTTLDQAADGRPIDLIKIDVEGFELDVLRGARGMLRARPPKAVMFEFNAHHLCRGHTVPMFADLLPDYDFYRLSHSAIRPLILDHYLTTIYAYQNLVAIHPSAHRLRAALHLPRLAP
jgi:FkbM family methyltransferase